MQDLPISCPSSAHIDTGVSQATGYSSVNVPSACIGGRGCVLKVEDIDSSKVRSTKYYTYKQETNGVWKSSYQSRTYTNGDSTQTKIIASYADGKLRLDDDTSGVETSSNQWTVRDSTTNRGLKVYICSFS